MRGTTLLDSDGNLILVPNITVIQSVVKNLSANQNKRSTFTIGVGFTESIKKCQELIQEALLSIPGIGHDPLPMIFVESMGTSAVNIKIHFWFNTHTTTEASLKSAAIVKTKEILLAHGIRLPDSARELVVLDPLKIQMMNEGIDQNAALKKEREKEKVIAKANFREAHHLSVSDGDHDRELQKIANMITLPTQLGEENLLNTH